MTPSNSHGTYRGEWNADGRAVITWTHPDGDWPPQRVAHVIVHSPDGLAWGYPGSGPADTALSILAHAAGDRALVEDLYQQFKRDHVARLPLNEPFTLPGVDVAHWLEAHGIAPAIGHDVPEPPAPATPIELEDRMAELDARQAQLDRAAAELAHQHRALEQQQRQLDARAAALRQAIDVTPAWALPAAPVAAQLRHLVRGTGDPIDTVAKGLDLEPWYAAGLLDGSITTVDLEHVARLCEALHASPYDLWGAEDARTILHAYGPELWPRYIEPLGPPDIGPPEPPAAGLGPPDPPHRSGPHLTR